MQFGILDWILQLKKDTGKTVNVIEFIVLVPMLTF